MLALFEQVDVLALPVTQVWPFAIEQRWPQQVAGRRMDTYHRWMESTLYATFAGAPAISLPADVSNTASVSIGPMVGKEGAFSVDVTMAITIPGMDKAAAEALVAAAHEVCPYSNATRGNINVTITVA